MYSSDEVDSQKSANELIDNFFNCIKEINEWTMRTDVEEKNVEEKNVAGLLLRKNKQMERIKEFHN